MPWNARLAPCSSTGRRGNARPGSSGDSPRPAHALDERGAHQEPLVQRRVGGRAAQLVEVGFPDLRVALFQPFLVRDGLLLYELDVGGPPAPLVTLEQFLACLPARDKMQRFGKLHRVVNAAIQAETPDRVVHV